MRRAGGRDGREACLHACVRIDTRSDPRVARGREREQGELTAWPPPTGTAASSSPPVRPTPDPFWPAPLPALPLAAFCCAARSFASSASTGAVWDGSSWTTWKRSGGGRARAGGEGGGDWGGWRKTEVGGRRATALRAGRQVGMNGCSYARGQSVGKRATASAS